MKFGSRHELTTRKRGSFLTLCIGRCVDWSRRLGLSTSFVNCNRFQPSEAVCGTDTLLSAPSLIVWGTAQSNDRCRAIPRGATKRREPVGTYRDSAHAFVLVPIPVHKRFEFFLRGILSLRDLLLEKCHLISSWHKRTEIMSRGYKFSEIWEVLRDRFQEV